MDKEVKTLSVRQLATLFDRSEQTVRRWKDKGINGVRLRSGLDRWEELPSDDVEARGGMLAFTVEAVREFVDRNPGLLDKAAPELELILYGKRRGLLFRKRGSAAEPELEHEETAKEDVSPIAGRAIVAEKDDYMLCLLERREQEILAEIELLNGELKQLRLQKKRFLCD